MSHDIDKEIKRGMELLVLCQQLQSEKDGIVRPVPGEFDRTKTLDDFAVDIDRAITNMSALRKLMPMTLHLGHLGRKLESEGKLQVDDGDDYSAAALKFVMAEHGLT